MILEMMWTFLNSSPGNKVFFFYISKNTLSIEHRRPSLNTSSL